LNHRLEEGALQNQVHGGEHMQDVSMSLADHLEELRKRLIWIILVLTVTMIAGFFAAKPLLEYLKQNEPASSINWNAFSPWDGIRVYMQVAFILSFVVTSPFTLYQLWSFVKSGLKETERKAALHYIPYSVFMFLAGLNFAYFIVFPLAFKFTLIFNKSMNLAEVYGVAQYFTFMFNILLPLSLLFELPIVVLFLTRLRILNPMRLRKMRRYAYMMLLIAATLVTPPDVISVLIVAIPLMGLYEISVLISRSIYLKQLVTDTQVS
jgi:sec-independent protein translocase protein TatC